MAVTVRATVDARQQREAEVEEVVRAKAVSAQARAVRARANARRRKATRGDGASAPRALAATVDALSEGGASSRVVLDASAPASEDAETTRTRTTTNRGVSNARCVCEGVTKSVQREMCDGSVVREDVRVGVRAIVVAKDGAAYVGREDGETERLRDIDDATPTHATTTVKFTPDICGGSMTEFVNARTAVRALQISLDGEILFVGYDNAGWMKVALANGLIVSSSPPHEDFADVFKYVDASKLSKYVNTTPQCRAMLVSDDLSEVYLTSPALRDSRVYAWDLTRRDGETTSLREEVMLECQKQFNAASVSLNDIDSVDDVDRWNELYASIELDVMSKRARARGAVRRLEFHTDIVTSLARVRDVLISAGSDNYIAAWDLTVRTDSPKPVFTTKSTCGVRALSASDDGETLYCGGADSNVRVYHVTGEGSAFSLQWMRSIAGHDGFITSMSAAGNAPFVVTGSAYVDKASASVIYGDGDIGVWRVSDGARMSKSKVHEADVTALAFTPDRKSLYSGDAHGRVFKHAFGDVVEDDEPTRRGAGTKEMGFRKGFLL